MNDGVSLSMDIQAAEARLPELIGCVERGEEIVLCRSSKPRRS
jgi:antitoxin (DNA-binding transcriptional repressor) of toxin-antitoxin stability system